MFDVPPPERGVRGLDAYRNTWPPFFEWLQQGGMFEVDSMTVTHGGDVGFAHLLVRCSTPEVLEAQPDKRLRLTIGVAEARRTMGRDARASLVHAALARARAVASATAAEIGSGRLLETSREMRGRGEPAASLSTPDIGVSSRARSAVGSREAGAGMYDGGITHNSHLDVMDLEVQYIKGLCGAFEEPLAIDDRTVGQRATEVVREHAAKPISVGLVDRLDVLTVQAQQRAHV
jgi:hypothetical protein